MAKIVEKLFGLRRYKCEYCGYITGWAVPHKAYQCGKCRKECTIEDLTIYAANGEENE